MVEGEDQARAGPSSRQKRQAPKAGNRSQDQKTETITVKGDKAKRKPRRRARNSAPQDTTITATISDFEALIPVRFVTRPALKSASMRVADLTGFMRRLTLAGDAGSKGSSERVITRPSLKTTELKPADLAKWAQIIPAAYLRQQVGTRFPGKASPKNSSETVRVGLGSTGMPR